ncbi:MAG: MMPL family transporter [Candidatus Delongbacteria bacterium]|jgi:predicted RND superfamily exporter protein|nr:MMPL family transporter [Candidatus Delongbacteria bacterium]
MREKLYKFLTKIITKHNNKVLWTVFLITLAMIYFTTQIGIKNRIADMMPDNVPEIESFNNIIEDFTSDAIIMISINSDSKDTDRMIECADTISKDMAVIEHILPKPDQDLSLGQKWKMSNDIFPVEGVKYDTINYVKRIDAKLDTDFFEKHGVIIQKKKDVENFTEMYSGLEFRDLLRNINDNFEQEFVYDSENLNSLDGEAQAVSGLNNIFNFINSLSIYLDDNDSTKVKNGVRKFIIGDDYMFSSDRTMLLVGILPSISTDDFDNLLIMSEIITNRMNEIRGKFPDLEIGLAGTPIIGYEEQTAIINDFGWSTLIALLIVMIIIIGSFRSWINPFNSIFTLIISIIWTAGLLGFTLKYLNTMSAAFGVILVGLGIDFAIHILSGYKDALDKGDTPDNAITTMFMTVGNGVLTGALTTSFVFLSLFITGFRAFTEMGYAMGSGILIALMAMFVLLPSLFIWDSREHPTIRKIMKYMGLGFLPKLNDFATKKSNFLFNNKLMNGIGEFMQFHFMERVGKLSKHNSYIWTVLILSAITFSFAFYGAMQLEYEYDMTKLEPHGMPAIVAQDKIIEKLEISPDFAMFSVSNLDTCRMKVKQLKKLADKTDIIGRLDAITEFFVKENQQKKNQNILNKYRDNILKQTPPDKIDDEVINEIQEELQRLHFNIVEIGELSVLSSGEKNKIIVKCDEIVGRSEDDKSKILAIKNKISATTNIDKKMIGFQKAYIPELREYLYNISDTTIIGFDNLPSNIKDRYVSESNGNLLISIYPNSNIWQEKNLRRFHEQTQKIDKKTTGLPLIMLIFIDLIKEKGTLSVILGSIVIIILLLLDFRSVKYTIMALVPLLVGAVWMMGLMYLFKMKLNLNNFMALPIIIGIGIDDGVHILHRYMIEGKNSMDKVTKHTGKAILLTSLTTMIGFGSIGLATHRGLASMGIVLVLGVGSCFISSAFLLTAMISLKDKIKYKDN